METLSYSDREDTDDQAAHFSGNHNPASAKNVLFLYRGESFPLLAAFRVTSLHLVKTKRQTIAGGRAGDVETCRCEPARALG